MSQHNKANHLKTLMTTARITGELDSASIRFIDAQKKMEFTDGKTIYIRNGDFNDPIYCWLTFGLTWHGAGHLKYSFNQCIPDNINASKFALSIFNVIEDVRMERLVKKEYRGAAKHLERMVALLLEKGWLSAKPDSPAKLIAAYLLYYARSQFNNDICLIDNANITYEAVLEKFGVELSQKLHGFALRIGKIDTFGEVISLTNDIINAIEQEACEKRSNRKKVSGEKPDNTASDALKSDGADLLPDLHDAANQLLQIVADKAEDDNRTDPHWLRQVVSYLPPNPRYFDSQRATALAANVKALAKRIIYGKRQSEVIYSQKGMRLSPARYSAALAGNKNIFEQSAESREPFSNVQIMIDTSGTMYGTGRHVQMTACQQQRIEAQSESWMAYANETVYALASGLKAAGHNGVAVDYFWSSDNHETGTNQPSFYSACNHLNPVIPERFAIAPQGTTPLKAAVDEGLFRLYSMPMPYGVTSLLILITDAKTESSEDVMESILRAKASGISILLICTADDCDETHHRCTAIGLSLNEYLILSVPEQMPSLLQSLIQQRIL
jgi:hypothetical protein